MLVKLLADGDRPTDIGLHGGNRGRGRNLKPENPFHDPLAAQHGGRCGSICSHFQHARLGHEAAPHATRRKIHTAHFDTLYIGQAGMNCQPFVQESEFGIDDIAYR